MRAPSGGASGATVNRYVTSTGLPMATRGRDSDTAMEPTDGA